MSEPQATPFGNKTSILSDLWIGYRNDADFEDFMDYNDISLPLSYLLEHNVVTSTPLAEVFINETWDLLLEALSIPEDTGFDSLDDLLSLAG